MSQHRIRFTDPDEIEAAYEAAENAFEGFVTRDEVLLVDYRAYRQTIGKVARAIADAVIRSEPDPDITTVPGVNAEKVNVT